MLETFQDVVDDEINRAGLSEIEAHFVRDKVLENMTATSDAEATSLPDEAESDMDLPVDAENFFYAQQLAQNAIYELEAH